MEQSEDGLLSVEEAASYLGVKRAAFWNYVKRYNIQKYKTPLGRQKVFFKKVDLDALRGQARPVE